MGRLGRRRRMKYTSTIPSYNGQYTDWTTIKNINKQQDLLQPCESPYACGTYFYHSEYKECERCRNKDMC